MALRSVDSAQARKRALVQGILRSAFWSYDKILPSKVSDGKLIEKILLYGDEERRRELFQLFPAEKIKRIWEQKLIIQEPRLHDLNRRIASSLFHISDPEAYILRSYQKHNLYDRYRFLN